MANDRVIIERSLKAPRLYNAKAHHVHSSTLVDVLIHTDFEISFTQRCFLYGVPRTENGDSEEFRDSKQCTIMLIGGRDIVIETVAGTGKKSNMFPIIVYRRGAVPVADCNVAIDGVDYVNINRYLSWLGEQEKPFDRATVGSHRRGLSR